jgi:hypothetical protein
MARGDGPGAAGSKERATYFESGVGLVASRLTRTNSVPDGMGPGGSAVRRRFVCATCHRPLRRIPTDALR